MLGRFATDALPAMQGAELGLFEEFLALPDPEIEEMIMHPDARPGGAYAALVAAVRVFNGLDGKC